MYYFCRRLLVLDAVVLPFAWNKTFTGFLHKIQVTRCNLTSVESLTFTHVERLQAIDISQNQISYLAKESFFGLTHLVTINLESNLLSSLPDGIFAGLSSLENILLRQNRITCIDAMTFSNLHYLKRIDLSWWRHQMETFSALLAICAGNSPVPGEFPTQRPVTRSFDVYFDLSPNKWLSKQPWGWWFETPAWSLWRHRNVSAMSLIS